MGVGLCVCTIEAESLKQFRSYLARVCSELSFKWESLKLKINQISHCWSIFDRFVLLLWFGNYLYLNNTFNTCFLHNTFICSVYTITCKMKNLSYSRPYRMDHFKGPDNNSVYLVNLHSVTAVRYYHYGNAIYIKR